MEPHLAVESYAECGQSLNATGIKPEQRLTEAEHRGSSIARNDGMKELNGQTTIEIKKKLGAEAQDDLTLFLDTDQDEALQSLVLSNEYFQKWNSRNHNTRDNAGDFERTIWFDHRWGKRLADGEKIIDESYPCENPLTATGLRRVLKETLLQKRDLSCRQRTLIYTTDPSPAYIRALINGVDWDDTDVLRDTIEKYLSFHTSICLSLTPYAQGFSTSYLALHLPFFQLREVTKKEASHITHTNPIRTRTNLSFLHIEPSKPANSDKVWVMDDVQTSIALTWSDENEWRGMGFTDSEMIGRLDGKAEPRKDMVVPDNDMMMDPLLAGTHPAGPALWNLKEYFLKVVETWIKKANTELKHLVSKLSEGVKNLNNEHPCTLSRTSRSTREQIIRLNQAFDIAFKTIKLLRRVHRTFTDTTEELSAFLSEMDYLRECGIDLKGKHIFMHLQAIRMTLKELKVGQREVAQLEQTCAEYSKILELRLSQQSKEANEKNKISTDFNIMLGLPASLTFALFSMPKFEMEPRAIATSFFLLILGVNVARHLMYFLSLLVPDLQRHMCAMFTRKEIPEVEGEEKRPQRTGFVNYMWPRRPPIPPDINDAG